MSAQDCLTLFGQTLDFEYYNGTGIQTGTLDYWSTASSYSNIVGTDELGIITSANAQAYDWLVYRSAVQLSNNATTSDFTVKLPFDFQFTNLDYFASCAGISLTSGYNMPNATWADHFGWEWSSTTFPVMNHQSSYFGSATFAVSEEGTQTQRNACLIPCKFTSQTEISDRSIEIKFGYASQDHGYVYFFLMCPVISGSGSVTSGGESGNDDITINIDMSETNSLLGTISSGISGIVSGIINGITNFFIPSQQDITNFRTALETKLQDSFGIMYTAHDLIHDAFANIDTSVTTQTITLPNANIPVHFTHGQADAYFKVWPDNYQLKLKPYATGDYNFSSLYTAIRLFGNMIVTLYVINTLRNKFDELINGRPLDAYPT